MELGLSPAKGHGPVGYTPTAVVRGKCWLRLAGRWRLWLSQALYPFPGLAYFLWLNHGSARWA